MPQNHPGRAQDSGSDPDAVTTIHVQQAKHGDEVIVLRAVERNSTNTVAVLLGIEPNAASMRHQRVLEKLRARVPGSVLDDFSAE